MLVVPEKGVNQSRFWRRDSSSFHFFQVDVRNRTAGIFAGAGEAGGSAKRGGFCKAEKMVWFGWGQCGPCFEFADARRYQIPLVQNSRCIRHRTEQASSCPPARS